MKILKKIIVFDAADIATESRFWARLLDGEVDDSENDWHNVIIEGEWQISVQLAPDHVAPDWPDGSPEQQVHLDFWVDDIDAWHEKATRLGAEFLQPDQNPEAKESFQVYADPAGHPFCFCFAR